MNESVLKKKYARIGRWYDLLDAPWEMLRYRQIRPVVWKEVAGMKRILDAGAGTGRNIEFYPPGAHVTGVDLSETMIRRALARRSRARGRVNFSVGSATALPFKNSVFDAVVSTFLFCVLPDVLQPPVLRELARVIRPGGIAVLLEYQYSQDPVQRGLMKLMSPWVEWAYGARFDRKTVQHLKDGKWQVRSERFLSKDIVKLIVAAAPSPLEGEGWDGGNSRCGSEPPTLHPPPQGGRKIGG